jgi:hypothetical protein
MTDSPTARRRAGLGEPRVVEEARLGLAPELRRGRGARRRPARWRPARLPVAAASHLGPPVQFSTFRTPHATTLGSTPDGNGLHGYNENITFRGMTLAGNVPLKIKAWVNTTGVIKNILFENITLLNAVRQPSTTVRQRGSRAEGTDRRLYLRRGQLLLRRGHQAWHDRPADALRGGHGGGLSYPRRSLARSQTASAG